MISQQQLDANRRNAAKSHGPITPEGRAAVRLNEIILPTIEEKIDFEQFRFAFEKEYNPVGPTEQVLVEDIITARWRLNRIRKMELGLFVDVLSHDAFEHDTYGKMSRYEVRF